MIILLTDFGQSEYVGVMKGVIYSIDRDAKIVDLCHDISPQNIIEASWVLKSGYKYFPEGAIFCCVVDPGVGTERKALGVKTTDYYFVAPDNGLLWETLKEREIIDIREIPIPEDASNTFHGRDVFAKAAANIYLGHFDTLGTEADEIERLELCQNGRVGIVVRVDRFGNVITNLPREDKATYSVKLEEESYQMHFYPNYHAAEDDELFLIEGSCSTLEISLRNGNANNKLNVETGEKIEIS
jgi:S-adenosylmethionine hydrolase